MDVGLGMLKWEKVKQRWEESWAREPSWGSAPTANPALAPRWCCPPAQ